MLLYSLLRNWKPLGKLGKEIYGVNEWACNFEQSYLEIQCAHLKPFKNIYSENTKEQSKNSFTLFWHWYFFLMNQRTIVAGTLHTSCKNPTSPWFTLEPWGWLAQSHLLMNFSYKVRISPGISVVLSTDNHEIFWRRDRLFGPLYNSMKRPFFISLW